MKTSGLTEKRMLDKRFQKTEQAIFVAYYKLRNYPSAKKLAKNAGVSRTTLYRHHKKVQTIPIDYEDYLVQIFIKKIKSLSKKNPNLKTIFLYTLVFISSNKEIIAALFLDNHKTVIKRMMDHLKVQVLSEWHLSGNINKIYNIYENEILGLIEIWYKQNFSSKVIGTVLNDVLYITKSARQSLLPLK